ncbi:hypothetical protein GCM10011491_09700 [Brucella endophytica]|uniref:Uncharacterized protein n=1 Tax=Brucella endophytica TaxID=1963359 RepID=A0A916S5S6_9HYPH|nr:hypothetical protein GCM10011491_09700 [Brucella endophytica]
MVISAWASGTNMMLAASVTLENNEKRMNSSFMTAPLGPCFGYRTIPKSCRLFGWDHATKQFMQAAPGAPGEQPVSGELMQFCEPVARGEPA